MIVLDKHFDRQMRANSIVVKPVSVGNANAFENQDENECKGDQIINTHTPEHVKLVN